jgi:PLP dependent protein
MPDIQPLTLITERLDKARKNSPLASRSLTILAASKGQGEERIISLIEAGITNFGENRVQEAESKWPRLKECFPHARLHLIGPLQTNKVKQALALFDVIQTIDREKLADAIAAELTKHPESLTREFLIQVNIGKEPQKAGVAPEDADRLVEYCRKLKLPVTGLMCIPPGEHPPAPYFALLREIAERNGLAELSMGMSEDFETAVRMGATCIRLGRVLFGDRLAA